jgi:hypothetical protein
VSNRKAVTKAVLNRVIDALEARGKVVGDVLLNPDGSLSLGLTTGERVPLPAKDQADTDWDKALGLQ